MENQQNTQRYPFQKMPLPYLYSALEPFIDTQTMLLHHDRHYGKYVDELNAYLEVKPNLQGLSLTELVTQQAENVVIRHNAGGVYNHQFFFSSMRAGTSQIIVGLGGKLLQAINRDFGSLEGLKTQFSNLALAIFGSGYAWLCVQGNGKLVLTSTANQDTPLTSNLKPLMCVDVWEHAYYLKNQNERDKYISNFWHVIDWVKVSERLG